MRKKLSLLFALLCASVMGWATIDWSSVDYLSSTEPSISMNTYKYAVDPDDAKAGPDGISNIQPAAETGILGLYTHYGPLNVVSCSHNGKISGTQLWVYVDQLTEKDTKITVTLSDGSKRAFHLYNKNGGAVDPNVPHASGKGFGTYIAKNVPFYTRVDNKADETQTPMGTADLYIVTYGNKMMAKAKLNGGATFLGNGYSMQFRIWNDAQTGFGEYWAQLRAENNTIALIDMNSNYCNLNQGVRTELPFNTYMETSAGTGAVPMFMYTLDYINAPIVGDETAPVISSAVASYSPITGEPTITITATDANDIFYKIVDPSNNISYSFSNTILLTTDGSNNVLTYTVYAIDYNGNVSSAENVNVQMKPALSNIARMKSVTAGVNQSTTGLIVDGNFNGDRWSSAGAIHYNPTTHPDDYQDWFYINFVNIYDLSAVRIKWETARPNNYTFRTSIDGTNWTTVASFTEYPTANAIVDYVLPDNTQGRFFGVWATSGYENLNYGISPFEVEVYGAQAVIEDHNPPTLHSAVLSGEPEWNQVRIAVDAEDAEDPVIYVYHVVDATHSINQECMVSEGIITVTGLSGETTYNLSVKAVDGAGNESDAIVVNATTPMDTSVPLVAAPTPDATGKEIRPIYSDAFASILAHPFDKDGWGGVPLMEERNISGDNCLIYNVASANEVIWGMYDDGNSAIIAADGYHSADGKGVDASAMTNLHIDIWSLQPCTNAINICINDAALKTLRLSHDGTGWNSYDIALSEFNEGAEGKRIDNVRWFKFNGIGPISGKMALDNVYFWAPASGMKSVSASSNNATMGSATVKVGEDDVTSVPEGTEVRFIATANPGYVFVNWTNFGVEVSTKATYVTTITETTNLVANFDYVRTTYCHSEVLTNNGKTLYLSISKVADNTYKIRIDGSAEARINGRNNFNFTINHTNDYSNEPYADGHGWQVRNEGYGYIENTFTANDYKALTFGSHYFAIGAQGGGEFILDNNFPAANTIAWNSTCSDTEAPAFNKAEAEVLNESSVRLKIQATDNWGGLLTYTIAREAAEPIISNHASGEEFTQDVTGLTAGTKYTFTITVSDGVNNANQNIVVTPMGDSEPPVMGEARLESKNWNSAIINVAATDNKGVTAYYVVEKATDYIATDGKITVEGLTAATPYTFHIKAKDAAGNISNNQAEVVFTTDAHLLAPATAAPDPEWPANQVISFYSDKYEEPSTWNYRAPWGGNTVYEQVVIAENNVIHYNNLDWVGWVINSGAPYNALTMEKLHLDIWVENDCEIGIMPIYGGAGLVTDDTRRVKRALLGQQWNSIDLVLATDYAELNLASIFQFKFDQATTTEFYLDNVYFYRESAIVDDDAPYNVSGNMASQSYFSVTLALSATDGSGAVTYIIEKGGAQVASTSGASDATVNVKIDNLASGTDYVFSVIAKDGSDNAANAINVNASTLAAPAPAPTPTHAAAAVKSLYSNAYTPVVDVENYSEWWWESPTVHTNHVLGTDDNVLFYDNNHAAGASFGWSWDVDNKIDFSGYQKLHMHIYPTTSGTIEIYPVIAPEGEFHKVSQNLIAGQWNEIVLDYTEKTFAPLNQIGFIKFYDLGDFFIDNVYFWKEPEIIRDDSWMAPGELGTICIPNGAVATGGDIYELVGKNEVGKIVFATVPNNEMEPGKPYLFEAKSNAMRFYYTSATPAPEPDNSGAMKGTFHEVTLTGDQLNNVYYFAGHALWSCVDLTATGLHVSANRAWVVIDEDMPPVNTSSPMPGRRIMTMNVNSKTTPTAIDQVNSSDAVRKVILDGTLYILRGEKLYDATGRLVK